MKLETDDRTVLYKAIAEALDTIEQLDLLAEIALGRPLNEIGAQGLATHQAVVMRVIKTAESFDRVKELIVEARGLNDHNSNLRKAGELLLKKLDSNIAEPVTVEPALPQSKEIRATAQPGEVQLVKPDLVAYGGLSDTTRSPNNLGQTSASTSWKDAAELESQMSRAVSSSNSKDVQRITEDLITRLRNTPEPMPERTARWLLNQVRRAGLFAQMAKFAEALISSGLDTQPIRRLYALALIDQGHLSASEAILQSIVQDNSVSAQEKVEARGQIGRIYKQRYIDYARSPQSQANLDRALNEYASAYRLDPQNVWYGINVVGLTSRAQRDNVSLVLPPDATSLAESILKTLTERESAATEPLPAWDMATKLEAYLALNRQAEATETAFRYVQSFGTDALEITSTLQQLTAIWQLNDRQPPGSEILPILQSALLQRQGASLTLETDVLRVASTSASVQQSIGGLEELFGSDKLVTLNWYKKGLEQCNSIGRVERLNGSAIGTGWLVNAADFFPGRTGLLFLTNNSAINKDQNPLGVSPDEAQVRFQTIGRVLRFKDIVWSSSYKNLNATFVSLEEDPGVPPLTLHKEPVKMTMPAPRVYIIGHPAGRDVEISMQDNHLLAVNETFLHYRTPTEPGSGGSPVFESIDWRVVALHHKHSSHMRRIDGEGTYEAGEGIAILALQKATQAAS